MFDCPPRIKTFIVFSGLFAGTDVAAMKNETIVNTYNIRRLICVFMVYSFSFSCLSSSPTIAFMGVWLAAWKAAGQPSLPASLPIPLLRIAENDVHEQIS